MAGTRTGQAADVGHDDCVDRTLPFGRAAGLRKGADGRQHFFVAPVGVAHDLDSSGTVEIRAGQIAWVAGVPETEIDRARATIDPGFQRWQAASRANQLRQTSHGRQ